MGKIHTTWMHILQNKYGHVNLIIQLFTDMPEYMHTKLERSQTPTQKTQKNIC